MSRRFLLGAAAVLPISMALFQALIMLGFISWAASQEWRAVPRLLRENSVIVCAMSLWTFVFVSACWAENQQAALREAWTYRKLLLVFPIALVFDSDELRARLLKALMSGWAVCLVVGLIGHLSLWFDHALPQMIFRERWGLLGVNYIQLGVIQMTLAFALIAAARCRRGKSSALLCALAAYAVAEALFMWSGRIALVCFNLLAVLGFIVWRPRRHVFVASLILAMATNWLALTHSEAWVQRGPLHELQEFESFGSENSTTLRKNFWRCAFDIWKVNPVIGAGAGSRPLLQDRLCRFDSEAIASAARKATAHQQYLQFLADIGVVGLGLFLALNLLALHAAWRSRETFTGQVILALLVVLAVCSLFNSFLRDAQEGHLWVFALALAASVARRVPHQPEPSLASIEPANNVVEHRITGARQV